MTRNWFHFSGDASPVRDDRLLRAAGAVGGAERTNRKPRSVRENCDLRGLCSACFTGCGKRPYSVILSEAKNLSVVLRIAMTARERFFALLRMTPGWA
jgi:hypothetical protein